MIVLLTPTGSRSQQFQLCARWMLNQTYPGEVIWIIVDDCYPITTNNVTDDFQVNWKIHKVYPTPVWSGQNTQARNIKAGIDFLIENYTDEIIKRKIEAIFMIEDDDYYKPIYLERMMQLFNGYYLIGETKTLYYNVVTRRYVYNPNTVHASLFQTAFTVEGLPYIEQCYYHKFIDCILWTLIPKRFLFNNGCLAIGMKGMPGRGGIGAGHSRSMMMREDLEWNHLRKLIGEDAKFYEGYYGDMRGSQYGLFIKKCY
jgi:hypothetical protein